MSGTIQASVVKDSASATNNLALDSSGNVTVGNNLTVSGTGNTSFSGNVGIGTTSPVSALSIYRGASINAFLEMSGGGNTLGTASMLLGQDSASGGYVWNRANAIIQFGTNNTERMRINSSGNVGIGTNSPSSSAIVRYLDIGDATSAGLVLTAVNKFSIYSSSSSSLVFRDDTAAANRMILDSSGNLMVNRTSAAYSALISDNFNGASQAGACFVNTYASNSGSFIVFGNSAGGAAGSITQTGATTCNYGASSDYRLKDNVAPLVGSLARVMALKPVSYNWTEDKSYGEGFIAHELQEHIPLAVSGEKDAIYEDGNIKPQNVDYGKLTTVLVAALQEAVAKITALEDRIAKLESGI